MALVCVVLASMAAALPPPADAVAQREQFSQAWTAASRGDRRTFEQLGPGLEDYILYPYYRYEHYRANRARIATAELAGFLERHADWGFAAGLRAAWLRTLGAHRRWQALVDQAVGTLDTELRCYLAQANLQLGNETGLQQEVQSLWAVGKSQPKACDPVFAWLQKQGAITPALAMERIRLAILAGNPRFAQYLARFLPDPDRAWVERWYRLDRARYRQLPRASTWPDEPLTRMLASASVRRLARRDADESMRAFRGLEGHFSWTAEERGSLLHQIALRGAISRSDDAMAHMAAVPDAFVDEQLLEWWARLALVRADWTTVVKAVERMRPDSRSDGRWRYWLAFAKAELGETETAREIRQSLALETSYYGFLAADRLGRPYTICPLEPKVDPTEIEKLRRRPGFARSLELRAAGIDNWALSEWTLATRRLDSRGLRVAAALAREEGWHDRVIFALGDSGDRRFYAWRFPVLWAATVEAEAARRQLDVAWVHGVMRSESALAETARSPAGALGLMQVTPATARRLARQHGLGYTGSDQLKVAEHNIRFGTAFMRELLDRFGQNPVLAVGAYNAGPETVESWLGARLVTDPSIWIETIPFFETRDYIPRVLAFTVIYDWRIHNPVTRLSSRMPALDSGKMPGTETTEVVCLASG
jgi:soluble lytic murein transglycosylase